MKDWSFLNLKKEDFDPKKTDAERIKELEEQNQMLIECLFEIADIVYNEE